MVQSIVVRVRAALLLNSSSGTGVFLTGQYCDKESHPGKGYLSWSKNTNSTPRDEMPAPVTKRG